MVKFLIDECLSLDLAVMSRERGFPESSHVVWLGRAGWKDWELKPFIMEGDWTFVTRNSADFRGPAKSPGTKGQCAGVSLHAGLVCIHGPDRLTSKVQRKLFSAVLDALGASQQLVNEVIEVDMEPGTSEVIIKRYPMPETVD